MSTGSKSTECSDNMFLTTIKKSEKIDLKIVITESGINEFSDTSLCNSPLLEPAEEIIEFDAFSGDESEGKPK